MECDITVLFMRKERILSYLIQMIAMPFLRIWWKLRECILISKIHTIMGLRVDIEKNNYFPEFFNI